MATLVSFHAHPDDESIACGGVLRRAYEEGHRVVLVLATRGEHGEVEVGMRAAGLAGTPRVYQWTMNRDQIRRGRRELAEQAAAAGIEIPDAAEEEEVGKPEREITAAVDVSPYLEHKRQAMRAHASQVSEHSFFLGLPDEAFRYIFGTEWFIRDGQGPGITETDLLAGL